MVLPGHRCCISDHQCYIFDHRWCIFDHRCHAFDHSCCISDHRCSTSKHQRFISHQNRNGIRSVYHWDTVRTPVNRGILSWPTGGKVGWPLFRGNRWRKRRLRACHFAPSRLRVPIRLIGTRRQRRGWRRDQMTRRGAAVAGSPVFAVPEGSIRRMCASSSATGQCSAPLGTTKTSPGPRVTSPSRSRIVIRPCSTRKKSSVSSCLCQTNSPLTLTTMRSCPLNCPTTLGCQCSVKVDSFCARLIACMCIDLYIDLITRRRED